MILRPYQEKALADLRQCYAQGKRAPIAVSPTGSGKTILASEVIRLSLMKPGKRALFLVPTIELLNQAASKLTAAGVSNIRTIQAQNDIGSAGAPVIVASIPTLVTPRWIENLPPADLVIVDECQHGKARTHEDLLTRYSSSKLLGLSATPQRGDGKALGAIYDSIVTVSSVKELTELGALVPCEVFAPPRIMNTRELALEPVDAYTSKAPDSKAIVFCATVAHAKATAEAFNTRGIAARWLSGESDDREDIITSFAADAFKVLVSVNCLIEGFDDPSIQTAIMARRFTHVGSWLQACGRVLRPHPSKDIAKIVDLCGSALVHGTPDLDRAYSLDGKGIDNHRASLRQCQACGGVFTQRDTCPYCQFATPPLTRAQAKALGLELHQVTETHKPTTWPMRAKKNGKCTVCGGHIEKGIWIMYSKSYRAAMHTGCASKSALGLSSGRAAA